MFLFLVCPAAKRLKSTAMTSLSSSSSLILSQQNLIFSKTHFTFQSRQPILQIRFPKLSYSLHNLKTASIEDSTTRLFAVAEETASSSSSSVDTPSEFARRVYIGNIPRNIDNDELTKIVQEHGAVEKAEVSSSLIIWCFGVKKLYFFLNLLSSVCVCVCV